MGLFPFRIIFQNENKIFHSKWHYEGQPKTKVLILDKNKLLPDGIIGIFIRKITAYKGTLTKEKLEKIADSLGVNVKTNNIQSLVLYELLVGDEKLLLPEQYLVEVTDEEIDRILNEQKEELK